MNKIEKEHYYIAEDYHTDNNCESEALENLEVTLKHMKGFAEYVAEHYYGYVINSEIKWTKKFGQLLDVLFTTEELIKEYIKTL